jgi:hypothetical protein
MKILINISAPGFAVGSTCFFWWGNRNAVSPRCNPSLCAGFSLPLPAKGCAYAVCQGVKSTPNKPRRQPSATPSAIVRARCAMPQQEILWPRKTKGAHLPSLLVRILTFIPRSGYFRGCVAKVRRVRVATSTSRAPLQEGVCRIIAP